MAAITGLALADSPSKMPARRVVAANGCGARAPATKYGTSSDTAHSASTLASAYTSTRDAGSHRSACTANSATTRIANGGQRRAPRKLAAIRAAGTMHSAAGSADSALIPQSGAPKHNRAASQPSNVCRGCPGG